jgi:hypothetical protein
LGKVLQDGIVSTGIIKSPQKTEQKSEQKTELLSSENTKQLGALLHDFLNMARDLVFESTRRGTINFDERAEKEHLDACGSNSRKLGKFVFYLRKLWVQLSTKIETQQLLTKAVAMGSEKLRSVGGRRISGNVDEERGQDQEQEEQHNQKIQSHQGKKAFYV